MSGEKMHCSTMSLAWWPDAAGEDQFPEVKRRLGYVIGLMSPTRGGPPRVPQRTPGFTRALVESSKGGEAYGRMALPRGFHAPFANLSPK